MAIHMQKHKERRRVIRQVGQDLAIVIGNHAFPVVDISTVGVSFQGCHGKIGDTLTVAIVRISVPDDRVEAQLTLRDVSVTMSRAEFHPTMAVMRYVVQHIGEATGASPAYFKPTPPG